MEEKKLRHIKQAQEVLIAKKNVLDKEYNLYKQDHNNINWENTYS
jgi:hypothetical protein